jgi:hypothetical protein
LTPDTTGGHNRRLITASCRIAGNETQQPSIQADGYAEELNRPSAAMQEKTSRHDANAA